MKLKSFAVWDEKAQCYLQPSFHPTKGLAIRQFTDIINQPDNPINKYPADFTLFEIGEYDNESGKLLPHPAPVSIGNGLEFRGAKETMFPQSSM